MYLYYLYNSTNHYTILILLITYDLLLHVSTLICQRQGASSAWLKLYVYIILFILHALYILIITFYQNQQYM
jgi:hypothetical protein